MQWGKEGPLEAESGTPGTSCCCPLFLWLQVSWEPLELRVQKAKAHSWGKGVGVLKEEHAETWIFLKKIAQIAASQIVYLTPLGIRLKCGFWLSRSQGPESLRFWSAPRCCWSSDCTWAGRVWDEWFQSVASLEAWSLISLTAPPSCVLPSGFLTLLITQGLPLISNAAIQDENAMSCFMREKMSYASLLSKHLGKEIDCLFKMLLRRLEKRQRKTFLHRSKGRMVCLL